jgi:hypothetical protein
LFTNQFADNSPDKEESANSDIINGRDSLVWEIQPVHAVYAHIHTHDADTLKIQLVHALRYDLSLQIRSEMEQSIQEFDRFKIGPRPNFSRRIFSAI